MEIVKASPHFENVDGEVIAKAENFIRRIHSGVIPLNIMPNTGSEYDVNEADRSIKALMETPESDVFILRNPSK